MWNYGTYLSLSPFLQTVILITETIALKSVNNRNVNLFIFLKREEKKKKNRTFHFANPFQARNQKLFYLCMKALFIS